MDGLKHCAGGAAEKEILKAKVFVPGHISGFFQPFLHENPLRCGSRNCGPCTEAGVKTQVTLRKSEKRNIEIEINGKRCEAKTSRWVAEKLLPEGWSATIEHLTEVPVGAGFGVSGAGALGVSIGLVRALGLKMRRSEIIANAHVAEVICRTGLGDVNAQSTGGLVIGVKPGAPPYGKTRKMKLNGNFLIVCCTLGEIKTSSILREEEFIKRAKELGGDAMRRILASPTISNFLQISRDFAERLGLMSKELREMCDMAVRKGALGASQAMLGKTVFAFCNQKNAKKVENLFREVGGETLITRISKGGASSISFPMDNLV